MKKLYANKIMNAPAILRHSVTTTLVINAILDSNLKTIPSIPCSHKLFFLVKHHIIYILVKPVFIQPWKEVNYLKKKLLNKTLCSSLEHF